jgi:hypothetical protein
MKNKKKNWLKNKYTLYTFSVIALLSGFLFMNSKNLTGNLVLSSKENINLNPLPLIGLALLICVIILLAYVLKKK